MTDSPAASTPAASAAGFLSPAPGLILSRMGFGAMRLPTRSGWGGQIDRKRALAVLRAAMELGVTHLDTSDFYGPYVVNELIAAALHPYPPDLHIVTKVGYRVGAGGSLVPATGRGDLVRAVHGNLQRLRLDALDVVNLRVEYGTGAIADPLSVLIELREQGLIRHLGVSNVSRGQFVQARSMTPIVCVQNPYNVATRDDDELVDMCARDGIAYVPFFPLGAGLLLRSNALVRAAAAVGATPQQVALAWLLRRSPAILLIPGTSSVVHLRENVAAAQITLPPAAMTMLDAVRVHGPGRY